MGFKELMNKIIKSIRKEEAIPEKQLFDEAFWAMSDTQRSHMMRFHVY